MDPLLIAKTLQYYKRREVQEAMLRHCANREVSPRYGEGFGKRPDALSYPSDILEFAKRKATSFHVSEERWDNPLNLKTGASRKEVNELRIGWDLVLDIDAKDWDVSRLAAWLCISVLQDHGITSISVKFSGSKGWHIGVPFESFPKTFFDEASGADVRTKDFFPEIPRAIASYLLEQLSDTANGYVRQEGSEIIFGRTQPAATHVPLRMPIAAFAEKFHKAPEQLFETYCPSCKQAVKEQELHQLFCGCGHHSTERYTREEKAVIDDRKLICPKCGSIMRFSLVKMACPHDKSHYIRRFNMTDIIQVDTILLAGRHLYRMPYSLHEKSGLASVVIDPARVLVFEKQEADPSMIGFERTFLDPDNVVPGEADELMRKAWAWQQQKEEVKQSRMQLAEFETPDEALDEVHFPPCIRSILGGMADGKKRAMFALTNFLTMCGWTPEMIEKRLHEWNEQNAKFGEPLREVIIKGHMHGVRLKKDKILPPNCKSFYQELGVCKPDEFCSRSKNPAQYAIKHSKLGARAKKAKKAIKGEAKGKSEEGEHGGKQVGE